MGSVASVGFYGLDTSTNCFIKPFGFSGTLRSAVQSIVSSAEQQLSEAMQELLRPKYLPWMDFRPKAQERAIYFQTLLDKFLDLNQRS